MNESSLRPRSIAGAVAALVLLTGCASGILPKQPDVGRLYTRSAQTHGPDRNPIIVIPGLTGSNLPPIGSPIGSTRFAADCLY